MKASPSWRCHRACCSAPGRGHGHGLGEDVDGLLVGADAEGLLAGQLQVGERLDRFLGPAPVVGQERVQRGKVLGLGPLVPLCDVAVQPSALGVQQQTVGHLLGHHVLEQVRQVRLGGVQHREVLTGQVIQEFTQHARVRLDRMHIAQDAEAEQPPDDAGHLQRQLLAGRETVDPRGHHTLDGLREADRA
jgi:hypothetical protein